MTRRVKTAWLIGIGSVMLLTASAALGQEADHLLGYKVTDPDKFQPPAVPYAIAPTGLPINDCVLKKAKFLLVQSVKDGGDDPRGGPAGRFVCYRAKCGNALPVNDPELDDSFGGQTLHLIKTQLVCLPSEMHICGDNLLDPGEMCDGTSDAACPGQCQPDCICPPPPPPACEATTGGFCWFFGALAQDCNAACAAVGRTCDSATVTYTGSAGTLAQCQTVLTDLGYSGPPAVDDASSIWADGCSARSDGTAAARSTNLTRPTTCGAGTSAIQRRVCACQ